MRPPRKNTRGEPEVCSGKGELELAASSSTSGISSSDSTSHMSPKRQRKDRDEDFTGVSHSSLNTGRYSNSEEVWIMAVWYDLQNYGRHTTTETDANLVKSHGAGSKIFFCWWKALLSENGTFLPLPLPTTAHWTAQNAAPGDQGTLRNHVGGANGCAAEGKVQQKSTPSFLLSEFHLCIQPTHWRGRECAELKTI